MIAIALLPALNRKALLSLAFALKLLANHGAENKERRLHK